MPKDFLRHSLRGCLVLILVKTTGDLCGCLLKLCVVLGPGNGEWTFSFPPRSYTYLARIWGRTEPPPPAPEASSMRLPSPPLPSAPSAAAAAAARPGSATAAGPDRPPRSEDGWGTLRHPPPAHGWALAQTTRSPSWPRHLGTHSPVLVLAFSAGADSSGGSIKFSRDFDWDSYFFSAK